MMLPRPPMPHAPRFYIHTLGCKVNQYDGQALSEAWEAGGRVGTASPDEADVIVLNTCVVTAGAAAEARRLARRFRRERPQARLLVTGCAAKAVPDLCDGVDGVELMSPARARADGSPLPYKEDAPTDCGVTDYPRARPVLKIQDGCSHRCTYCIVPLARGASRSRPLDAVLAEAEALLTAGFSELVVSGINLNQYGRDLDDGRDLWDLLAAVDALVHAKRPGAARLRLSSLDPGRLDAKALDTIAACRTLCPHLHLSLQSADPGVLRNMGRARTRPEAVAAFLKELRGAWPRFALGADILTGFPGESSEAFAATLAFCRELPLSYAHVFPYSKRPGTPAAALPGQVAGDEKKARAKALRDLAARRKQAFIQELAALPRLEAIVETLDPPKGTSEYYVDCFFEPAAARRIPPPKRPAAVRPVAAGRRGLAVVPLEEA